MSKVKITVISSKCRGGYCKAGDEFIVDESVNFDHSGYVNSYFINN